MVAEREGGNDGDRRRQTAEYRHVNTIIPGPRCRSLCTTSSIASQKKTEAEGTHQTYRHGLIDEISRQ